MHRRVRVKVGDEHEFSATLTHSSTASAMWDLLPVAGRLEVRQGYVLLLLPAPLPTANDSRDEMAIGEMGYDEGDHRLAFFFGRTAVSRGGEPRAERPLNPVGMLEQEPGLLGALRGGELIKLERLDGDEPPARAEEGNASSARGGEGNLPPVPTEDVEHES